MNKKICHCCSKKLGLLFFECKCGYNFCSKHRLPESHQCKFNHREYNRTILKEKFDIDCNFKKIEQI